MALERDLIAIIVLSCIGVVLICAQYVSSFFMMIRWYRENPIVDYKFTRSIKVGIAPGYISDKLGVEEGYIIPEADRNKSPMSMRFCKQHSVPGIPI